MRTWKLLAAAGLGPALLVGLVAARGSELGGADPRTGKAPPAVAAAAAKKGEQCSTGGCNTKYGTTVEFVATPREAAEIAKKEQKLVFVLHISGLFEDPKLT
jgi:hypothetical protein